MRTRMRKTYGSIDDTKINTNQSDSFELQLKLPTESNTTTEHLPLLEGTPSHLQFSSYSVVKNITNTLEKKRRIQAISAICF